MILLPLFYYPSTVNDISHFLYTNDFLYFNPHKTKSVEESLQTAKYDKYFGLYYKGEMIAYGMLRGMDEGYEIPMLGIAVANKYQGKGIGRLMMSFLETEARLLGYNKMRLRVHPNNINAVALYIKLGYKALDEATKSDYLFMEKEL